MRIVVTAGPTRAYIDPVRFLSNASSGRMGCAAAAAAVEGGHEVTLLAGGPAVERAPDGVDVHPFTGAEELQQMLHERFAACDALVMAAAVGDFRPLRVLPMKIPRAGGPMALKLVPTEDILMSLAPRKGPGQVVVSFALETGDREAVERKARGELARKGADFVVVNTDDAVGAEASEAAVLAPEATLLPWARRTKRQLAEALVSLIEQHKESHERPTQ